MTTKPTLKSLAAELQLSVTQVSRALAGYDDVSPATRSRVREAARRVGYAPNLTARRLVTGRANAIAMIVPLPNDELHDPFVSELLIHITQAMQDSPHLDLLLSYAAVGAQELELYQRFISSRRVDGFILIRTQYNDPRIQLLLEHKIPFITHGRSRCSDQHAWVDTDAMQGFADATKRLLELQHHHIALLNLPADLYTASLREEGFRHQLAERGLSGTVINCSLQQHSAYQATVQLMQQQSPPTALLCSSDILALDALKALRELGLNPGSDVSVIGCDDLPLVHVFEPELASLSYSFQTMGELLVRSLQAILQPAHGLLPQRLVQYELQQRATLAACPSPR